MRPRSKQLQGALSELRAALAAYAVQPRDPQAQRMARAVQAYVDLVDARTNRQIVLR